MWPKKLNCSIVLLVFALLLHYAGAYAQQAATLKTISSGQDLFSGKAVFIENKGQYAGITAAIPGIDKVLYGFEGFGGLVLFTRQGLFFLQNKKEKLTAHEEEQLEREGLPEEEIERRVKTTRSVVTLQWQHANTAPVVVPQDAIASYFTYGLPGQKAKGFKKLVYKNVYPGIDLVYRFDMGSKTGFEYRFIAHPGADANCIKMKIGGDAARLLVDAGGQLIIQSAADTIYHSPPVCFNSGTGDGMAVSGGKKVNSRFYVSGNTAGILVQAYNKSETLVIDPFISAASGFSGINGQIAREVDFDYQGNVFISGGGTWDQSQLSKFSAAGVLLWTFNGALAAPLPGWKFGTYYGAFTVEKSTGKVYIGQGVNVNGTQVIRLDESGVYDNFISAPVSNFRECWKLAWNCINGSPQLLICGGSTASSYNFSTLSPPGTAISPVNITNNNTDVAQDIADVVVDPLNNDLYTIYASLVPGSPLNNRIYKHRYPYSSATVDWSAPSGYTNLREGSNQPFLQNFGSGTTNSIHALAVNASYLFYWDGLNLRAFDKTSGLPVGSDIAAPLTLKMQGGIYADACNNVFIGYTNGLIKVYKFTGTAFDDAAAGDITITGFENQPVFDLTYNEGNKLLYAAGNGFVAAFDIAAYCSGANYTVNANVNCITYSVTGTLTPTSPAGTLVTYSLYNGPTLQASNNTGVFGGLATGNNYTLRAFINQACSGTEANAADFSLNNCSQVVLTTVNEVCGAGNGSITAYALFGTPPYQYSLNGGNFSPANTFTGLAAGSYTVMVKDFLGVIKTADTVILNIAPVLSTVIKPATCNLNNGVINATVTGGKTPYLYSIDGVNFQPGSSFTALSPGPYIISVRDGNNCPASATVTVNATPVLKATVATAATTCRNNDGSITVTPFDGTAPYRFSLNGGPSQNSNIFTGLATGNYNITVSDAADCQALLPVAVGLFNNITVDAGPGKEICKDQVVTLNASAANASTYNWTPAAGLSNPAVLQPLASPAVTTTYLLTAGSGVCIKTDIVTVVVNPRPVASAGPDTVTCFDRDVQLTGSGGLYYNWSPPVYLSSRAAQNPVVKKPRSTTAYYLLVTDANGCTSAQTDTVVVTVLPRAQLFAGNDTSIAEGQPLQLLPQDVNNTGFTQYTWQPATGLNNAFIPNPQAILNNSITYRVRASTPQGCTGEDDVIVKVFKAPEIYVPGIFTPNNDGANDIAFAVPVGTRLFKFFKIYNRWGQLVFSTGNYRVGWDGRLNGKEQPAATYVWIAEAIDFKERPIRRKGVITLAR
jgi:gliding motility-associated-like protein